MIKRSAFFHCVFALLLLAAQQGALLHAMWHTQQRNSYAHKTHAHDQPAPQGQASLCVFDMAFGQVLGGTHSGGLALAHVPAAVERIHDLTSPRLLAEALSPKSRGPPVLL